MKQRITALMKHCGLGEIVSEPSPVSGGLMHKMFRVETTSGVYAVKCLNPEIMKRPNVLENYAKAERLEGILEENGIPVVAALTFDGRKMIELEERYYYVFPWFEGIITDWNAISSEQCRQAGAILGRIHSIPINKEEQGIDDSEAPELSNIDFPDYLETASNKNSKVANLLFENMELLENAQRKMNEARLSLPPIFAICDDDMDPKNVMWKDGKPYVIDLECLEVANPAASALNLSLQWAGTVNSRFEKENLKAFFDGYLSTCDNDFHSYADLYGIAYVWVEWLEYNLRRALGMEGGSEEDISLGEEEAVNTIDRIRYLTELEEEICELLRTLTKK